MLLAACGGGGGSTGDVGSLHLALRWPGATGAFTSAQEGDGGFGNPIPAAAVVARIVFQPQTGPACCIAFRPHSDAFANNRRIVLTNLQSGTGTVTVSAYAGDFAPADGVTTTCQTDSAAPVEACSQSGHDASSFRSNPKSVPINPGVTNNAGEIPIFPALFIVPGSLIPPSGGTAGTPVDLRFTLAHTRPPPPAPPFPLQSVTLTQGGESFDGIVESTVICDDAGGAPFLCSPGGVLQVRGVRYLIVASDAIAGEAEVNITAQYDDAAPPLALDDGSHHGFSYGIQVALSTPTATATPSTTLTSTLTPTSTATLTPTETATPSVTQTPTLSFDTTQLAPGSSYRSLALGDMDAQQGLDIVASNEESGGVDIFVNSGNGTFDPTPISVPVSAAAFVGPYSLAVGLLNSDNFPDIVTVNRFSPGSSEPSVAVLLSQAALVYQDPQFVSFPLLGDSSASGPGAIAIRPAEGLVGNVDLIAGSGTTIVLVPRLSVDGTFGGAQVLLPQGNQVLSGDVKSIVAADLTGDGATDFVGVTAFPQPTPSPAPPGGEFPVGIQGDGLQVSSTAISPVSGVTPADIAVGRLDADANVDLAVALNNPEGTGNLMVRLGDGMGGFGPPVFHQTGGGPAVSVAVGDLSRDGNTDVVLVDTSGLVSILLGRGDGTFDAPLLATAALIPTQIKLGDLNGDGRADVAISLGADSGIEGTGGFSLLLQK